MSARVLIVEDDHDIREAIAEILRDMGYEVNVAENGQVAFDALQAGYRPHLILLDLMMPVMDGWELRAALLREPALASIPVIVVSASAPTSVLASLQVAAVLSKPMSIDTLANAIAAAVPAGSSTT